MLRIAGPWLGNGLFVEVFPFFVHLLLFVAVVYRPGMEQLAKRVVQRLQAAGYAAYFVGGWVRDWLLQRPSADIDIATAAPLAAIIALFAKTRLAAARFGVVRVIEGRQCFEVATLRRETEKGRHPQWVAGSLLEDAQRRDFTINGMFYDPIKGELIDLVGGQADLQRRIVRTIGDPRRRLLEDRLRLLRAVRYAHCLRFSLAGETRRMIGELAGQLLPAVSIERIIEELRKMAAGGDFAAVVLELFDLGLLAAIFPQARGLRRATVVERQQRLAALPGAAPLPLLLLELLAIDQAAGVIQLATACKLARRERDFLLAVVDWQQRWQQPEQLERIDWVRFYARGDSDLLLGVFASRVAGQEKTAFWAQHQQRRQQLAAEIARWQQGTPVVTARHLLQAGVAAGPQLGKLLQAGQRLAINAGISKAEVVIAQLKQTVLWPPAGELVS